MKNHKKNATKKWYTFEADTTQSPEKYTWRDWVCAGVVTLIAAVLAFVNLGDMRAPQNFWTPERGGYAIVEFYEDVVAADIQIYRGATHHNRADDETDSHHSILVSFSSDGEHWQQPYGFIYSHNDVFSWLRRQEVSYFQHTNEERRTGRYVRIESDTQRLMIGQIGFRDAQGYMIPIRSITSATPNAEFMMDSQDIVPVERSFMNSTYFDEIFHPRSAYEMINDMPVFEATHPQLGKLIMSFFINIFGMTPFGWRFAGALFGVLMIPLLYFFARDIFKSTYWATFAAGLFAMDFMRFTQTRIATIDTFVVFFALAAFYCMYKYWRMSFYDTPLWKTFIPLCLSGIFMGLGIANKWQGLYVAVALAVMFFVVLAKRFWEHYKNRRNPHYANFTKLAIKTCLWCVLFFGFIPLVIYALSFVPYHMTGNLMYSHIYGFEGPPWFPHAYFNMPRFLIRMWPNNVFGNFMRDFILAQGYMWWYHGTWIPELPPEQMHPFASQWHEWVFNVRPILYYVNRNVEGYRQTIVAFGNPLIWWGGVMAIIFSIYHFIRKYDKTILFLLIGFFAMLVPWMGVQRMAFIYHYFPAVPFLILLTVFAFKKITEMPFIQGLKDGKVAIGVKYGVIAYPVGAAVLFAMFYPVLSGTQVSVSYIENFLLWPWFNHIDRWVLI